MIKKIIMLLLAIFIISSFATANVAAWTADDYDQNSRAPDTTPHANTAHVFQEDAGYTATPYTNANAADAYNRLPNDDIFFYAGHAMGGYLESFIGAPITQKGGSYNVQDQNVDRMILAVYSGCNSADRDKDYGCFLDGANQGISCVLGWNEYQYWPMAGTWLDRFWDCMRYWDVSASGQNANVWTWVCFRGDMGQMNCWSTSGNANQMITH